MLQLGNKPCFGIARIMSTAYSAEMDTMSVKIVTSFHATVNSKKNGFMVFKGLKQNAQAKEMNHFHHKLGIIAGKLV